MKTLWLLALAAGCSEYELSSGPEPQPTPSTGVATGPSTTVPTGGPDEVVEPGPGTILWPEVPTEEPETPRDEKVHVDTATQADSFAVDVLWVVDNSCSMEDDQDSLTTHFPTFIEAFEAIEGVDYHVGVVSTDMEDPAHQGQLREGQGVRWLEVGTPDKAGAFDEMARMGTDGSGDEAGRAAVHYATQVHANGWNAGFFREDAALAVVVISDEEDSSSMFGVDLDPFVDDFLLFKADPALVSFSTIIGPVPDGCATADAGFGYDEAQARIGGVFHSICDADWDAVLEDLAERALSTRREFFLTDIPDPATLTAHVVEADGAEAWFTVGVDFTYDPVRNSITFTTYLPGPLAEVNVEYVSDFGSGW